MENDTLSQRIMHRVYVVYMLRRATSPTAFRMYSLVAFFVGIVSLVSVGNVIANLPTGGFLALYDFSMYAFMHTELVVQLLVVGALGFSLWLVRDCTQYINSVSLLRHT